MKTLLALFLVGWLPLNAFAQSTNNWFTLDAAGGVSTSATYSASCTLGQADAGKSTSANYTIIGGFWAVSSYTAAPNPPELNIAISGPRVLLWWPTDATGFVLQRNQALDQPANWVNEGTIPTTNGVTQSVLLAPFPNPSFFRLKKN